MLRFRDALLSLMYTQPGQAQCMWYQGPGGRIGSLADHHAYAAHWRHFPLSPLHTYCVLTEIRGQNRL